MSYIMFRRLKTVICAHIHIYISMFNVCHQKLFIAITKEKLRCAIFALESTVNNINNMIHLIKVSLDY